MGSNPARSRETSRIWLTSRRSRSLERPMISTSRACFGVSGPGTPSASRWAASRTDVSGERSSCEKIAKNSSFISSSWRRREAIALKARASTPSSS
jgi:hypothetical protein